MANEAAAKHGVPLPVLAGLIQTESNWDAAAKNPTSSAQGLGQFIKVTAKQYKVDVTDPASSIDGAARYLKDLHRKFGDWSLAVRGYHDGEGNLDKLIRGKGGNMTQEAREYAGKVLKAGAAYGQVPEDKASSLGGAAPVPSALTGATIPFANPLSKNPAVKALKLAPVEMDLPAPTITAAAPDPGLKPSLQTGVTLPPPAQVAAAPALPDAPMGFTPMASASLESQPKPSGLTALLEGAFGKNGDGQMLKPTRPRGYDGLLDRLIA
jgi:hypothetical protein